MNQQIYGRVLKTQPVILTNTILKQHDELLSKWKKYRLEKDDTSFYYCKKQDISVWESPQNILKILAANNIINEQKPLVWLNIPTMPQILIYFVDGKRMLYNRINKRITYEFMEELMDMFTTVMCEKIEWIIQNFSQNKVILNIDQSMKDDNGHTVEPEKGNKNETLLGKKNEQKFDENCSESIIEVPDQNTEDNTQKSNIENEIESQFFECLKEYNISPYGNYEEDFENQIRKHDPRLKGVNPEDQKTLLEKYMTSEKEKVIKNAAEKRKDLNEYIIRLCEDFHRNSKIKTANTSLFKAKYKFDKKFKDAQKLFDIDSIFKETSKGKQGANSQNSMEDTNDVKKFIKIIDSYFKNRKIDKSVLYEEIKNEQTDLVKGLKIQDDKSKERQFNDWKRDNLR